VEQMPMELRLHLQMVHTLMCILNGVLLKPTTDYNTSTANTIAGLSAFNTSDEVTVIVYDVFTVGDMVSATSGGTFSGNVAMGGTLSVTGTSTLTGNVTFGGNVSGLDVNGTEIILDADADTSITADTDDRIDFRFGGTDSVHMDVTGVGVNVTNPLYPFHTRAASGGDNAALFLEGPNDGYSTIYMGDTDDIDVGQIQYDHSVNALTFKINAAEKATLRNGFLKVRGSSTSYQSASGTYHEFHTDESATTNVVIRSDNSSYTGILAQHDLPPSDSTSNAKFIACYSSNPGGSADLEFYVRVDGQAYADGSFNGGGADYAEFFEWKDGNTSDENRVGCSVVLDGNQIRKATSSDNTSNIIGVISVNPSVVGDADGEFWKGTYLKDDFGKYIFKDSEQVEWTDKEGVKYSFQKDYIPSDVTVPSDAKKTPIKVRTLNPDYDKSKTYERREDRKEWDAVGLMGKLRMLKGQPTGDRWIKMRDISDTVEEWLVR
jgi:hypothetical protein